MKNTRKISLIVIHCSATRVTQDFTFEKLEACHLARGFRSIGYHYYITKDGVIYPCLLYTSHLMRWIQRIPDLLQKLAATGYGKNCKEFTPMQVSYILYFLGEP